MTLQRILDYSHTLMEQTLKKGDIAVDGTCGNGHDTLFLAKLVGEEGHVHGFDVQQKAIQNTIRRLEANSVEHRVSLYHESHSHIKESIPSEHQSNIQAAIFNLGYLPGSDKQVVTTPTETISSVENLLTMMKKGGLIVLVVYHGHSGGDVEREAVVKFVTSLDQKAYSVLQYGFINQRNNPPFILAIEKQ
ncbi:class I SAM-dependent methyltransferase [Halobacillus mangrovi]|uniref:16S rRNA (Cytosine(1402)-N(4))-methyltransferase n=1 Tax=Halobacillus mangrovi TaxID=402384 RepID=A0A1W5ZTW8_9BACI|nr:class I SAM-dependent methyltransferase [Halobacillus mangrovi]ARI76739.1 16S rRNA (cytosine(1402)-N(4))-methyltransferase [Halobacillus mangrovi]